MNVEEMCIVAGLTLGPASLFSIMILTGLRQERAVKKIVAQKKPVPKHLERIGASVETFFRQRRINVMFLSAHEGYKTSTLKFLVEKNIQVRSITNLRLDLEHYLLNSRHKMKAGTLTLKLEGKMLISFEHESRRPVLLSELLRKYHGHQLSRDGFILGTDSEGHLLTIPVDKQAHPHMLLIGTTGSGKTFGLLVIAINALLAGFDLYVFNPKLEPPNRARPGLWDLKEAQGVVYLDNIQQMVKAARELSHSMQKLTRPTMLIVDEASDALATAREELAEPLGTIAQKGREYDLHLCMAVPKSTKSVMLDDLLHANSGTTLIMLRVTGRQMSLWATGQTGLQLDMLAGAGHTKVKIDSTTIEGQIAIPDNLRQVAKPGGKKWEPTELMSITQSWFDEIGIGGRCSYDSLRRYASSMGKGMSYPLVQEQVDILVRSGRISRNGSNRPGVKVR
jgi:hypothetical protein